MGGMDEEMLAFWNARLNENEAAARATSPSGRRLAWKTSTEADDEGTVVHWVVSDPNPAAVAEGFGLEPGTGPAVARHIALHDPARTLREVEADRLLLMSYADAQSWLYDYESGADDWDLTPEQAREKVIWYQGVVEALLAAIKGRVAIYSDHPGYQEKWKP